MTWYSNRFVWHVLQAASGTTLSALLMLAAIPLLTRWYRPDQFGLFATFVAISTFLSSIACGKYEIVVPVCDEDDEAWRVVQLTGWIGLLLPAFVLLGLLAVSLHEPLGSRWSMLWLLPLSIYGDALTRSFSLWMTRKSQFGKVSIVRVVSAVVAVMMQLILGYARLDEGGLTLGYTAGIGAACLLAAGFALPHRPADCRIKIAFRHLTRKYQRYPKFLLLAHGGATFCSILPVFFLTAVHGEGISGFFAVATRIVDRPTQIVGQALGQVFYPAAARNYARRQTCWPIFKRTFSGLLMISGLILVITLGPGPLLVNQLLGPEWHPTGTMLQILAPMFAIQFLHTPVCGILMIRNQQHVDLIWTMFRLVITFLGLAVGLFTGNAYGSIIGLSAAGCLAYATHLGLSFYFAWETR